jgi:hypothetical protein
VPASEVEAVADRFGATPFDIDANVLWSHRGEKCTFDVMVEEFGSRRRREQWYPCSCERHCPRTQSGDWPPMRLN